MSDQWEPGQPVGMKTERFVLRSLVPKDASDIYVSWWNDAEIQQGFGAGPRGWSKEDAQRHIARFNNKTSFHLGIFLPGDTLPLGFFAVFLERQKLARTNILIGNKDYWGKDVALEVRTRVLNFLFRRLGVEKVYGKIHGRNYASMYNYTALGFTAEGVQRSHIDGPDGERLDVMLYGILRDEWIARQRVEEGGDDSI